MASMDLFVFFTSSTGLEPATFRLGGKRSILMSYEDIVKGAAKNHGTLYFSFPLSRVQA